MSQFFRRRWPSPAIVPVFSSPLALALHRRRAAVGLFFPLRRSLFLCLLSTSDHPPRLHLLLSPPSLTPASFSSLSRHFSLFAGLTMLPSSSEPPQPSTSASPSSLLRSSPPMHQIAPFPFYTHDPRGFSFADDHGCCLSSFFLLTVSLCFLTTTSTATCLFFSDLRPRDLSPCCRLFSFSFSIVVGSFAVGLLGFVDLIKEPQPPFPAAFSPEPPPSSIFSRRRPPSFFVVGSRCHHADAVALLHRLPPLLSLLSRLHHRGRSPPRLSLVAGYHR